MNSSKTAERADIKSNKNPKNNITTISLNLTCATVGLVLIFIPKLFFETGVILGTLMLIISGILSFITCLMLTQSSIICGASSFPELCQKIMGKYSSIVEFFFALNLLGMIIGNPTFVSDSISGIFIHLFFPSISVGSKQENYMNLLVMFATTLLIVPFIISKDISSLKKISTYSAIGYLIALYAVITVFFFPKSYEIDRPSLSLEKMEYLNWEGLTTATGMFFLAMAVHVVVIDIHSQLRPRNEVNTFKLISRSHTIAFVIFYTIGLLGYLCVYQDPQASSLNNFFLFFLVHKKINSIVLRMAQLGLTFCFAIGNIFAYLPLIKIVENFIILIKKETLTEKKKHLKSIELADNEQQSITNGNSGMITKNEISISDFESSNQRSKMESNEEIMIVNESDGYKSRTQNKLSGNSTINDPVSKDKLDDIIVSIKVTQGETLYKKIALFLQGFIMTLLFIIIKNKISLYVVFNIVSAICYPTICMIFPSLFFMATIKKKRDLTTEEKGIGLGVILIGIGVLFFMVINLFD